MLRKRNYSTFTVARRPNIGPLLPPSMGGGFRRVKRAALRKAIVPGYTRRVGFYGRYSGAAAELKFFDTAISFTADATAEVPATGQLSLIPQGVTQSTRVGRKATVKSIYCHGYAQLQPGASADASTMMVMYLMQDTQCNGAAATVSGATGIFTGTDLPTTNMNLANGQRFKILKKWVIAFNPGAGVTTAYSKVIRPWTFYKKCQIPLEFDSAADTGAITTIRSNNIFLVAGTDGNSDDQISVAGSCRLRFSD